MNDRTKALKDLRRLFDGPEKWIQGSPSLNSLGHDCSPNSSMCVCWCVMGGISKVTNGYDDDLVVYSDVIDSVVRSIRGLGFNGGLASWNDDEDRTFEDVLSMIDQCIEFERIQTNSRTDKGA